MSTDIVHESQPITFIYSSLKVLELMDALTSIFRTYEITHTTYDEYILSEHSCHAIYVHFNAAIRFELPSSTLRIISEQNNGVMSVISMVRGSVNSRKRKLNISAVKLDRLGELGDSIRDQGIPVFYMTQTDPSLFIECDENSMAIESLNIILDNNGQ